MKPGVGKSGSPAPKPMTGLPAALSALVLLCTASVADSGMAAMRPEMRGWAEVIGPWWHYPGGGCAPINGGGWAGSTGVGGLRPVFWPGGSTEGFRQRRLQQLVVVHSVAAAR